MKIKICGMKLTSNIIEVSKINPDYMGFIFWEKSKRFFNGNIPNISENIKKTGVFVDSPINVILNKIKKHDLNAIQLHGDESIDFCKKIKLLTDIEIIKVFKVNDNFNFNKILSFDKVCDYYLFDTKGKLPGGNGFHFDWEILKKYPYKKKFFLSGGIGLLDIYNLKKILKLNLPIHAIDVNSKFELRNGIKNVNDLSNFKKQLLL
jgi:phosphoribosylanthranilate isomerase